MRLQRQLAAVTNPPEQETLRQKIRNLQTRYLSPATQGDGLTPAQSARLEALMSDNELLVAAGWERHVGFPLAADRLGLVAAGAQCGNSHRIFGRENRTK